MLTDWHREDITAALIARGWGEPEAIAPEAYFEGERLVFTRDSTALLVSFVADLGAGHTGPKSLEEAVATKEGAAEARLWLHRRRDSNWRRDLSTWAETVG